jgi:hypothetical protein
MVSIKAWKNPKITAVRNYYDPKNSGILKTPPTILIHDAN